MSDKLRLFCETQVVPLVPAGSPYKTVAYWMARCREVGLDFDKRDQRVAKLERWDHVSKANPDAIAIKIACEKRDTRRLCEQIKAEARANRGRPVPLAPTGPPPNVY